MLKVFRSKKGFTMVELMVVAIIVAILAAVAIPLMSANKKRAYGTEAESTLGMIRSMLRTYYAEYNQYPVSAATKSGQQVAGVAGIASDDATTGLNNDLDGTFFSSKNYTFSTDTAANAFTIKCTWDIGTGAGKNIAPRGSEVNAYSGASVTLDQAGNFVRTGY